MSFLFAGPYGAVHQTELRRISRNPEVGPAHVRLFMLAMAEANQIGHAEFRAGALRKFLGRPDRATGRVTPSSAATVSDAIAKAKRLGMLHADSCARCLVLSSYLFQKAGRGTMSCSFHNVRKARIEAA